ncbi:MAG: hypothetical protein ACUVRA_07975, partial [Candidatus Bathyarchaeaceae archaeon]
AEQDADEGYGYRVKAYRSFSPYTSLFSQRLKSVSVHVYIGGTKYQFGGFEVLYLEGVTSTRLEGMLCLITSLAQ